MRAGPEGVARRGTAGNVGAAAEPSLSFGTLEGVASSSRAAVTVGERRAGGSSCGPSGPLHLPSDGESSSMWECVLRSCRLMTTLSQLGAADQCDCWTEY